MLRPATLAVSLEGTHPLFFVRDDLLDATRPDCFLSAAAARAGAADFPARTISA